MRKHNPIARARWRYILSYILASMLPLLLCAGFILMVNVQNNRTQVEQTMVAKLDLLDFWDTLYARGIIETRTELHAGEAETSLMLHLQPNLVHMDKAVDFVPEQTQRSDLNYGGILRYCPDGVWGESRCATPEKGKKILDCFIEESVKKLDHIFSLMEKKEKLGYSFF